MKWPAFLRRKEKSADLDEPLLAALERQEKGEKHPLPKSDQRSRTHGKSEHESSDTPPPPATFLELFAFADKYDAMLILGGSVGEF